ncbi:MAG: DUF4397 domain-containing protein [Caldilineaceae bacterium]
MSLHWASPLRLLSSGGTLAWASPVTQEVDPADANLGPTVTVAHFAPFASETISTSVTVRINGSDVITGFTYPQVVRNAALSSGSTLIEILPTGTNTVAISATVTLTDDTDYTVSAIGDGTNQGLELFAQVDDNLARPRPRTPNCASHTGALRQHAGRHPRGHTRLGRGGWSDQRPHKASSGYLDARGDEGDDDCGTLIDVPSVRLAMGRSPKAAIGDGVNATTVAPPICTDPAPAVTVAHFAPLPQPSPSVTVLEQRYHRSPTNVVNRWSPRVNGCRNSAPAQHRRHFGHVPACDTDPPSATHEPG